MTKIVIMSHLVKLTKILKIQIWKWKCPRWWKV